jgi:sugar phosphate isomerase/epimerase
MHIGMTSAKKYSKGSLGMLSVSTVVFDGHDMGAGFDVIAGLGLRAVEPAFIKGYIEFDELAFRPAAAVRMANMLAQSGLQAAALSAHIDLGETDSADRLLRRLDFAARIGAPVVVTNATGIDRQLAFEDTLQRCLPEFAARGVILALENPGHGTGSLIPNGFVGAALVQAIGDPWLRLNYDIANAMTYGERTMSARDDLARALPWCARLHLKDIANDGPDWTFCAIGDGDVGYGDLLDRVLRQPHVPDIGLELPLRLTRPGRHDPVRKPNAVSLADARSAISRSVAFFQNMSEVVRGKAAAP